VVVVFTGRLRRSRRGRQTGGCDFGRETLLANDRAAAMQHQNASSDNQFSGLRPADAARCDASLKLARSIASRLRNDLERAIMRQFS